VFRLFVSVFGPRLPVFRLWYHFECVSIVSNPHLLIFCTKKKIFLIFFYYLQNCGISENSHLRQIWLLPVGLFSRSHIFPRNRLFRGFLSPQDPYLSIVDCDCPRYSVGPVLTKLVFQVFLCVHVSALFYWACCSKIFCWAYFFLVVINSRVPDHDPKVTQW
jgi:hypothetical protein